MTDCEGVAGVLNWPDFGAPGNRCYDKTLELTTLETNAAIEGALDAGATEILVADGHGHGAIEPSLLHPEAQLLAGRPLMYPFGCDETFDAAFMIGQHAKSNTDGGHLCHTGSFAIEEMIVNGKPMGEIALMMLSCSQFGVPMVLVAGDFGAAQEARELVPEIETAVGKWGEKRGSAAGIGARENVIFNGAARHLSPVKARAQIRDAAKRALERREEIKSFWVEPPYELEEIWRDIVGQPARRAVVKADTIAGLFTAPRHYEPVNK